MSRGERTRRATIDVTDLWRRIAKDNFSAAERLVDRFDVALEQLARNPHMGEAVNQIRQGLCRFPFGNYVLYDDPLPNGIRLQRVVHAARSLQNVFEDDDVAEDL